MGGESFIDTAIEQARIIYVEDEEPAAAGADSTAESGSEAPGKTQDDDGTGGGQESAGREYAGEEAPPAGDADEGGEAPGAGVQEGGQPGQAAGKQAHLRFRSHIDAEEGYRNLFARTTRAEQENARLRKELEELRKEREKIEAQKRKEEIEKKRREFIAERYSRLAESLEALDPDDPEYAKKHAALLADAQADIMNFTPQSVEEDDDHGGPLPGGQQPGSDQGAPASRAGDQAADAAGAADYPPPTDNNIQPGGEGDQPYDEPGVEVVRTLVAQVARQEGIDPESDPVFGYFAAQAPYVDDAGRPIPLDEQVKWACQQAKAWKEAEKKRLLQEVSAPMPRSGSAATPSQAKEEKPKQISLDDAINRVASMRTI